MRRRNRRRPRPRARRLTGALAAVALAAVITLLAPPGLVPGPGARTAHGAGAVTGAQARPFYYVRTRERVMALTFDLSWGTKMLDRVLPLLRARDQRATFFVSGPYARTHPEQMRALVAAGMEIASHGAAHVDFSGLGTAGVRANVAAADADLASYYGAGAPRLIRPPNGDWSPASVAASRALGYETVIWSIDSLDWMNPGVGTIVRRVTRRPFPGAIILLHASDTCKQTDRALPAILDGLHAQGYQLVTLGALMRLGPVVRQDPRGSGVTPNTT